MWQSIDLMLLMRVSLFLCNLYHSFAHINVFDFEINWINGTKYSYPTGDYVWRTRNFLNLYGISKKIQHIIMNYFSLSIKIYWLIQFLFLPCTSSTKIGLMKSCSIVEYKYKNIISRTLQMESELTRLFLVNCLY